MTNAGYWKERALYFAKEARELDAAVDHTWVVAGIMGIFIGIGFSLVMYMAFIR